MSHDSRVRDDLPNGSERKNLLQVPDCYRDGDDSQKK